MAVGRGTTARRSARSATSGTRVGHNRTLATGCFRAPKCGSQELTYIVLLDAFRLPAPPSASRPSRIAALGSVVFTCALILMLAQRSRPEASDSHAEKVMIWLRLLSAQHQAIPHAIPAKTQHESRPEQPRTVRKREVQTVRSSAGPSELPRSTSASPPALPLGELGASSGPSRTMPDLSDTTIRSAVRAGATERSLAARAAAELKLAAPVGAQRLEKGVESAKKRDCEAPNSEEAAPLRGLAILAWTALSGHCAGQ